MQCNIKHSSRSSNILKINNPSDEHDPKPFHFLNTNNFWKGGFKKKIKLVTLKIIKIKLKNNIILPFLKHFCREFSEYGRGSKINHKWKWICKVYNYYDYMNIIFWFLLLILIWIQVYSSTCSLLARFLFAVHLISN